MFSVFFRVIDDSAADEAKIATKHFFVTTSRIGLTDRKVIARYSALPFYQELEADLKIQGSTLINTYKQHLYIARFEWYEDVEQFTPKTYFQLSDVPKDGGPYVLKGKTNSKKLNWKRSMYAQDYLRAAEVYTELCRDDLIRNQGIIIREFVPLKTYELGIDDLPFSNEWRFFFYKEQLLSYGYYWSNMTEHPGEINEEGIAFAQQIARTVSTKTNFFVLDIAEKESGGWTLIEINDGQMSGLSGNSAEVLYSNLRRSLS